MTLVLWLVFSWSPMKSQAWELGLAGILVQMPVFGLEAHHKN